MLRSSHDRPLKCVCRFHPSVPAGSSPSNRPLGLAGHELKHDGYRLQIHLRDGRVRLYTINGADWSKRYPLILLMLNGEDLRRRPYVERKAAHQHIRCVWIHCQPREQVKRKSRSGGPLRLFLASAWEEQGSVPDGSTISLFGEQPEGFGMCTLVVVFCHHVYAEGHAVTAPIRSRYASARPARSGRAAYDTDG